MDNLNKRSKCIITPLEVGETCYSKAANFIKKLRESMTLKSRI